MNESNSTTAPTTSTVEPTTTSVPVNVSTTHATPTNTTPISMHAFCSNNHAGVKWMVDESNNYRGLFDPERIDSITIKFRCQTPEETEVSRLVA